MNTLLLCLTLVLLAMLFIMLLVLVLVLSPKYAQSTVLTFPSRLVVALTSSPLLILIMPDV